MLAISGDLCDGLILHSSYTIIYTDDVIIRSLKEGASRADRNIEDLSISGGGFIVAAKDQEDLEVKRHEAKQPIFFDASPRSYSDVSKVHGWQDTHEKLYRMSQEGEGCKRKLEIIDEMLDKFAVIGTYDEKSKKILHSYGKFSDSVSFSMDIQSQKDEDTLIQILHDSNEADRCQLELFQIFG
jgi:Luciferase-like monooxygenase.